MNSRALEKLWHKFSRALDVMSFCRHARKYNDAFAGEVQTKGKQGISLSEICAPPWKVKTFMVTRWDLQSKFRWSLTAWTMLFTTTLALLVKRKYFILNLIGRQRVIPCTSDSKQFN